MRDGALSAVTPAGPLCFGGSGRGRPVVPTREEFTDMHGFSGTNLYYMRQVFLAWSSAPPFVQQLVGQIPWGHHVTLVSKLGDRELVRQLPEDLQSSLPTVEELEEELEGEE